MGDEVRRTQQGNNNGYCHDDESTWFDWSLLEKHSDVFRYVQLIMRRRLIRDIDPEQQRMTLAQWISTGIKGWHGVRLNQPDWNTSSHSIAVSIELPNENMLLYFIFNAYWEPLEFELPPLNNSNNIDGSSWHRWIDTYLDSPQDIVPWQTAPVVSSNTYRTGPHSIVILWANKTKNSL
jgi:isoamylase